MVKFERGRAQECILLVEDSSTQALRMRLVLERSGFHVEVCANGTAALARVPELEPDMILLDMHLPDMTGVAVAQRLKADGRQGSVPIIFITEVFRNVADVITGFDLGVDDYLIKPVDDGELVARIRASLRNKQTQRDLGRMARVLMTVHQVGLQLAGILDPAVLLRSVVSQVRDSFGYPHVHLFLLEEGRLIMASAEEGALPSQQVQEAAVTGRVCTADLDDLSHPTVSGGRSVLAVPFGSGDRVSGVLEVVSPVPLQFSELDRVALQPLADLVGIAAHNARLYQQMEELATRDVLTGMFNRRAILDRLSAECDRTRRYQRNLSVVLVDMDGFKQINDTLGHAAGDEALQHMARIVQRSIREVDLAGRLGGDEFLLILPETEPEQAEVVAERLRAAVEAARIRFGESEICLRISLGLAGWNAAEPVDARGLLRQADQAMYRAKATGGNQMKQY